MQETQEDAGLIIPESDDTLGQEMATNSSHSSCLENSMDRRAWWATVRVHVCVLICFSPAQLFATPWTAAHQAPLSMGFSRQEYWSRSSFPSLRDLSDPRMEPMSLTSPAMARRLFTTIATWGYRQWGRKESDTTK